MKPLFADWELSKILLLLLGCFTFGAVTFFVLTLFIKSPSNTTQQSNEIVVTPEQIQEKKNSVMASIQGSGDTQATTSITSSTQSQTSKRILTPEQKATGDPNIGRKLDILDALNKTK